MSFIKYRVREVAADFGMTPKEVSEVAGKYFDKPKSNSQVLTDEQLNVIFDHITQNRQIDSLEQVFAAAKKPDTVLMTEGSIFRNILFFSAPLILGNLLQQTYNAADSIIVGNFVGSNALAAVGSSTSLIYLLIAFSQGASVGASDVMSTGVSTAPAVMPPPNMTRGTWVS